MAVGGVPARRGGFGLALVGRRHRHPHRPLGASFKATLPSPLATCAFEIFAKGKPQNSALLQHWLQLMMCHWQILLQAAVTRVFHSGLWGGHTRRAVACKLVNDTRLYPGDDCSKIVHTVHADLRPLGVFESVFGTAAVVGGRV